MPIYYISKNAYVTSHTIFLYCIDWNKFVDFQPIQKKKKKDNHCQTNNQTKPMRL